MDNNNTNTSTSTSTAGTVPPKYYCHTCKRETSIVPGKEDLTCSTCNGEFVEEVDIDDPPTRPPPASAPAPNPAPSTVPAPFLSYTRTTQNNQNPQNPIQPIFLPYPPTPDLSLLPVAQQIHQLFRLATGNNNNNTNTIQFQFPFFPFPFPNAVPLAGNPGDYAFGNMDAIINQIFQNHHHAGNPPAAKTAVEQLNKGKINETQLESKLDCAICKEEFTLGSDYIEMPCKHIFDKECILQWLAIHNSCPVCRFELKTDNADYEARARRS